MSCQKNVETVAYTAGDVVPFTFEEIEGTDRTNARREKKCLFCDKPRAGPNDNLFKHLKTNHDVECKKFAAKKKADTTYSFPKYLVECYYLWLSAIIGCNLPLTIVAHPRMRNIVKMKGICYKTLKKTLTDTACKVRAGIKKMLKNKPFGLMFDGWTENGYHFCGIFANYADDKGENPSNVVLLGVRPLLDQTNQSAENHRQTIIDLLNEYDLTFDRVAFIVADNTNVNPKIASDCGKPMIGCFNHKLNLAIKDYILQHDDLITKMNNAMVHLSGSANRRGILRKYTSLVPCLYHKHKWDSLAQMMIRYFELYPIMTEHQNELMLSADCFITPPQISQMRDLLTCVKDMSEVSKSIQTETLMMHQARLLFDSLCEDYEGMTDRLSSESNLVKNKDFDNAVVKIQIHHASKAPLFLTDEETAAVVNFRLVSVEPVVAAPKEYESRLDRVMKKQRLQPPSEFPLYDNINWIHCTTNVVERLFSKARHIYAEFCQSLSPGTLEKILLLKCNEWLWSDKNIYDLNDTVEVMKALNEATQDNDSIPTIFDLMKDDIDVSEVDAENDGA